MKQRRHTMPFGAAIEPDGAVRFRLWAPSVRQAELVLESDAPIPMHRSAEGWFELTSHAASAGSRYAFRIDGGLVVPDPASRFNPQDVHRASVVVDPHAFVWDDDDWRGRPWHEAVIYEVHVGTFSPQGTFAGVQGRLDHLVDLGVTAIELMPIADFPGTRSWGYDGVLCFAPDAVYGSPDSLKSLIAAAHRRGIAVLLDVVYNHFGPEGNYLHAYAPEFSSVSHQTPWGAAINFDGPASDVVREFFVHNALYWLEEYHFDGLRFDAVHAICDDSKTHILHEIARRIRQGPGRSRAVWLMLENDANQTGFLGDAPQGSYDAQWNDDAHHCFHVTLTGERDGYYEDYATHPQARLARALCEGFVYQGEYSVHAGRARGEPSAHLPPTAFVSFLQNHDQIGNRAFGERLCHLVPDADALFAATVVLLLAPSPPLLFMGEEWAAAQPFVYFCDFEPELGEKVREGRRREFSRFERFHAEDVAARIPDPLAPETFARAKLDWHALSAPAHAFWLQRYRQLLRLRQKEIVDLIPRIRSAGTELFPGTSAFRADWHLTTGECLRLVANLTAQEALSAEVAAGRIVFAHRADPVDGAARISVRRPWSVAWTVLPPSP